MISTDYLAIFGQSECRALYKRMGCIDVRKFSSVVVIQISSSDLAQLGHWMCIERGRFLQPQPETSVI